MKTIIVALLAIVSTFIQAELPPINQKIVEYTKKQEGKKVDRGECWDLASFALTDANAKWSPPYNFGTPYDFKKQAVLPGDIIQFENVEFKGELYSISMPHHTAVVVEVIEPLKFKIAHQNFAGKKTVQFTDLNFNDLKKGKAQFYRPQE